MIRIEKTYLPRIFSAGFLAVGLGLAFPTPSEADNPNCRASKVSGIYALSVASQQSAGGGGPAARVALLELRRDGRAIFRQSKFIEGQSEPVGGELFEADWTIDEDCFGLVDFPSVPASGGGTVEIDFLFVPTKGSKALMMATSFPFAAIRAERLK